MGRLSEQDGLNGLVSDNGFEFCFFCGNKIEPNIGGVWTSLTDIAVCKDCSYRLLDLFIDTLDDTDDSFEQLSINDKSKYITNKVIERLNDKYEKKLRNTPEL